MDTMFLDFPRLELPLEGLGEIQLPDMYRIRQQFDGSHIGDTEAELRKKIKQAVPDGSVWKGKRLAITVGSRGIPSLEILVRTICSICREWGADPFVIPAMGSHGGATAEGQAAILKGYGITEERIGAPVISSMETVRYASLQDGTPLYCDRNAFEADGVIIFNKVKPHTDFRGKHESGLGKMIAIGMAKTEGSSLFHTKKLAHFPLYIPQAAQAFIDTGKAALAVGVVENACDQICRIEACAGKDLIRLDAELQAYAKTRMPRFPFQRCDVLIVDEIGKDISGSGMDPNITGRNDSGDFQEVLDLQRLVVLDVTDASCHNGCGINLCDLTVRRCLQKIDWYATWLNNASASMISRGQIPMYAETDAEAVRMAIRTCVETDFAAPRIVRIRNTKSMSELLVSETLLQDIRNRPEVTLVSGPEQMPADNRGFFLKNIWENG